MDAVITGGHGAGAQQRSAAAVGRRDERMARHGEAPFPRSRIVGVKSGFRALARVRPTRYVTANFLHRRQRPRIPALDDDAPAQQPRPGYGSARGQRDFFGLGVFAEVEMLPVGPALAFRRQKNRSVARAVGLMDFPRHVRQMNSGLRLGAVALRHGGQLVRVAQDAFGRRQALGVGFLHSGPPRARPHDRDATRVEGRGGENYGDGDGQQPAPVFLAALHRVCAAVRPQRKPPIESARGG